MSEERNWRLLLPASLRRLPPDLAAVVCLVVLVDAAALLPAVRDTQIRVVLGLPFVLFIPGYAFISALFPEDEYERSDGSGAGSARSGIDGLERVAFSFGTSIAVVALVGLLLNFTPWGIRLVPILVALSVLTLATTSVAALRRQRVPESRRFVVPYRDWAARLRAETCDPETRADAVLNVVLVVCLLLAVSSVAYAIWTPQDGESFTEFYLLTENEEGEFVADDYPTNFTQGEGQSLHVGVTNQEHETLDYIVVVELQRVETENNSTRVLEERELHRFEPTLGHNETWRIQHTIVPPIEGERLRLSYLLYKGSPPADPTVENADQELHLWVNVSDPSS
ncbi:DUF1616 domain-containing protein [Halegenticoccus tardaugens]|uniref:DUF1616 domain-containing protein n=1 Tax=Halegenticoccus tardaugens TaxID=2071624 RepID=UPI00100B9D3D|nr:DUF1616 domain-containing protein [Halegenticoccus tardaugens]